LGFDHDYHRKMDQSWGMAKTMMDMDKNHDENVGFDRQT
jgi:hypothetical protein